jgi:hypothetical protein
MILARPATVSVEYLAHHSITGDGRTSRGFASQVRRNFVKSRVSVFSDMPGGIHRAALDAVFTAGVEQE